MVNGKYLINGEVYVHDLQKPLRTRLAEVQKILKKTLKVSEAQTLSLLPQAHALGFLVVLPALASIVMVFGVAGIGKMYYSCGIKNYQKITDILNGAISGIKALLSSDNPDCRPATEEERAAAQKKLKTNKTAQ